MRVGVLGAGAIGTFVGARLVVAGVPVTLLARTPIVDALRDGGLTIEDLERPTATILPGELPITDDPAKLASCDVVLVTVKGPDSESAGRLLRDVAPKARVVSLQNGIANVQRLREGVGHDDVHAGTVAFNVAWTGPTALRRATSGPIVVAESAHDVAELLANASIPARAHADMLGVQWGKLVLNLNNAVNALSGLPLRDQLSDRGYRKVTAAAMREGLAVARAQKIVPRAIGRVPPSLAPRVLPLPDRLFRLLARPMLAIDPGARSSMLDDLDRGRPTEIEDLCGEVVRAGTRTGVRTPMNTHLRRLVLTARDRGTGSPHLGPADLWPLT